jgi:integrase
MTSRDRPPAPQKYLPARKKGQPKPKWAYTHVYENGKRRMIRLGEWGSPSSYREYRRIAALDLAGKPVDFGRRANARATRNPDGAPTVAELCAQFLLWSEKHHRDKDGTPTGSTDNYRHSLAPLLRLYRDTPCKDFDVTCLELVRREMECQKRVDDETPLYARSVINERINRIRTVFRRGVEVFKLVPPSVWSDLRALSPLGAGQTEARETHEVPAVPEEHVEAVRKVVPPTVSAMIQVQLLSAARPGEIVIMRPMDINRSGDLWVYKPRKHKNEWRGPKHKRRIKFGEKAQAILRPFLLRAEDAPMFSPVEAETWRKERKAERRTSPPSTNRKRDAHRKKHPKSEIADAYTTATYRKVVERACKVAGVPKWTPNQLRHRGLTNVSRIGGREAARAVADHKDDRSIDRYVEIDHGLADEIIRGIG